MENGANLELIEQKRLLEFVTSLLEMLISQRSCLAIWRELLDKCTEYTESNFGILGVMNSEGKFDLAAVCGSVWHDSGIEEETAWDLMSNIELPGIWKEILNENNAVIYNQPPGVPWVDKEKADIRLDSLLGVSFTNGSGVTVVIAMSNKNGGYSEKDKNAINRSASVINLMLDRRHMDIGLANTNRALSQSRKDLDNLTHMVTHNFKEPLQTISDFSGLLAADYSAKLDEKGCYYLGSVSKSAGRMKKIIEDFLEISRLRDSSGSYERVNSGLMVKEVISSLQSFIKEKKARVDIQDAMPEIVCDKVRYKQVFYNLLSNALRYCDKPRAEITIGCKDSPKDYIFFVKDNGIGVPKEDFDNVFIIFMRLHNNGDDNGTGAGLTMVKTIVEAHNGTIWLESESGQGSTFFFTLPKKEKKEKLICTVR